MRFIKMHGAGNDYVFLDCFRQALPRDAAGLARVLSDRHRGIGSDGLILILPSAVADARMRIFNADGSEAEMCGNGVRCVARYLYEEGLAVGERLRIETGRGLLELELHVADGRVEAVRVDMGRPLLKAAEIPCTLSGDPPVSVPLTAGGQDWQVTCLSMGNPHCVIFVDDPDGDVVERVGPQIERHPAFPNRTNVEFVQVISSRELHVRVWERGSGRTQACGTGACAAAVAGVLTGRTARRVTCRLPGGDLDVEWAASGDVFLTGPAVEVFRGQWSEGP